MPVEIIYETHSITTDNETGIATGWLPGRLSETGRRLARELGQRRSEDGLAVVFTSDLARAVETAEIAFAGTGIPLRHDPRLRECNYGTFNGMPVTELARLRFQHISKPFPGGQSYQDVVDQTRDLLIEIARDWDGKKILLIAHSANRWALANLLTGVPLEEQVDAPFGWQEGWRYTLPTGWNGS
ncbi:histidine phosphatase family protein [Verrucosispora sp. WMMD703]|uniref:histidine phosphatase family protein n=1 Tax=unclassified Micromonospora TaxID=2617518 RepID=UPI00249A9C92|nr:histidine phosphatase family protein [Verrucosispora sp. WMMD1129]WFE45988.1 histidine phosphatase family protein [Verrucosispora sp. WMMD1129]